MRLKIIRNSEKHARLKFTYISDELITDDLQTHPYSLSAYRAGSMTKEDAFGMMMRMMVLRKIRKAKESEEVHAYPLRHAVA